MAKQTRPRMSTRSSALLQKMQPSALPVAVTYRSLQGDQRRSTDGIVNRIGNRDSGFGIRIGNRDSGFGIGNRDSGFDAVLPDEPHSDGQRVWWWTRLLARRGRGGRGRFPVDELLQLLARLEIRHLLRRHVHLVAGLRIAALARLPFAQAKAAESPQLDLL